LSICQESFWNRFCWPFVVADFLESRVGSRGGYQLSRRARQISVGDLLRRLEGRLTIKDNQNLPASELSAGNVACRLINERLTDATGQSFGSDNAGATRLST